ncbi:hypothetical protein PAPYR_2895 [Paratrimastix pyriformis]|uniref:Uncharacterized protein n=1 Tax=Paratrimastix pyriformis TaxID=342808 RepID=A0ABQ8UND0_9EUKA|nr:hypothetical protein PAPYR_2895 [Paratrimastix pyriformis]
MDRSRLIATRKVATTVEIAMRRKPERKNSPRLHFAGRAHSYCRPPGRIKAEALMAALQDMEQGKLANIGVKEAGPTLGQT